MNADELVSRLRSADEDTVGKIVNQVADSYRRGADLRSLIPLLEHSDPRIVSIATWIVSEVVDEIRGRELFDALVPLIHHSDPAIRFGVIESIVLLVAHDEHSIMQKFFLLAADPNPGVRQQALYWLCRIPDTLVDSLQNTAIWPSARLLTTDASKDQIRAAIKSKNLFDQRMAIAGALRHFGNDDDFVEEIFPFFDREVVSCLPRLRTGMKLGRD
jgi:hypothetical protein